VSDTLIAPRTGDPALDDSDDTFTHIVVPADAVTEASILGTPVVALCGWVFVPMKDPKKHPRCQMCQDIYAEFILDAWGYEGRS
jgi:hypothetical protein